MSWLVELALSFPPGRGGRCGHTSAQVNVPLVPTSLASVVSTAEELAISFESITPSWFASSASNSLDGGGR